MALPGHYNRVLSVRHDSRERSGSRVSRARVQRRRIGEEKIRVRYYYVQSKCNYGVKKIENGISTRKMTTAEKLGAAKALRRRKRMKATSWKKSTRVTCNLHTAELPIL